MRQIFLWDDVGKSIFNNFTCVSNTAVEQGGCIFGVGIAVINNEAVIQGNLAENGGCICERARVMRSSGSTDVRVIRRRKRESLHGLIRLIQCACVSVCM